ncbi:hypothetical protein G6F56_009849 [Rhizopus delemar]|nr:hypothetical protein G6F56_009849 [Rhizopus delemar]
MIKNLFLLPSSLSKPIADTLTQPLSEQKPYIRKFDNDHWKGALIMPEIEKCDDESAIRRLINADIIIFEVHGGGFILGHSTMFMDSFISWIDLFKEKHDLNVCVMSIDYRLAPTYKYPIASDDCIAAYNYLTQDLGVSPSKIVCSGDSAGGNLLLEVFIKTYAPGIMSDLDAPRTNFGLPLPAGVLFSSPFISGETKSESWEKYGNVDVATPSAIHNIARDYYGQPIFDLESLPISLFPRLSKAFDRFLPKKTMVVYGDAECLRDSIVDIFEKMKQDGTVDVTFVVENLAHDWLMFQEIVSPEDKHLIQKCNELFVEFSVKAVKEAKAYLSL